jgi:8-oxo-dGTP diphosphatase
VSVFLIRHAKAGDRELWTEPDHLRPVTKNGRRQAEALVRLLKDEDIKRVISSPYVRCVQTVEPLADDRGLPVEYDDALAEGAPLGATLTLLQESARDAPALCTHGDVVENVIGYLEANAVPEADVRMGKKGSTWVLTPEDGKIVRAVYLPPPG